jgi:hypothetical protein
MIPTVALTQELLPHLSAARAFAALPDSIAQVALRAPSSQDKSRWQQHAIANRQYEFALPITFTPYASAQPCSARCQFCSENLRQSDAKPASLLRPSGDYFSQLSNALNALRGLHIGYSLSGLETTDNVAWMMQMLDVLQEHAAISSVGDKVLYTNAAGIAVNSGEDIVRRLVNFNIDWLEISRHHFDGETNQRIMRFRPDVEARDQAVFERALAQAQAKLSVKLVCIVQRGGIDSAQRVADYLDWARRLGVRHVIFREFSSLDATYKPNTTARYLRDNRVSMVSIVNECLQSDPLRTALRLTEITEGYYFWNITGAAYGNMRVTFEASDYAAMHRQHDSQRIYKLVFHANGNLCAGWNPEEHVLLRGASA